MKLTELVGLTAGLKTQLTKVALEQQKRFDALSAKIAELQAQLDNADVPAEAVTTLAEVQTLLQQLDDTIPDVEPGPTTPPTTPPVA